jgi:hypothetical protein
MTQMTTTLEQRLYAGDRARELLENEAFIDAFKTIEDDIITQWKQAPARDAEGRERLWNYLALLTKLRSQITVTLETGRLAQLELEHKHTVAQRLKNGWTSLTA